MKSYFDSPEKIARLTAEANAWIGTPWCANSEARGLRGGVSCHNLPRAIYIDCEFLPKTFPRIVGDPHGSKFTKKSVMAEFLDARPEFKRVEPTAILPGDLIGVAIGPCVNHLGVALGDGNFIHVLLLKKTTCDPHGAPPWSQRIQAVWRPVHE